MFFFVHVLVTLCRPSSSQESFVTVNRSQTDDVANVVYGGIGLSLLCPTVEPDSIYLYEGAINTNEDGQFQYRHLNGAFTLDHIRGTCRCSNLQGCSNTQSQTCDQLIMRHVEGQPVTGQFQIRYSSPSLNITRIVQVDYGPPRATYSGPLPIRVNSSTLFVTFQYRSPRSDSDKKGPIHYAICQTPSGSSSQIFTTSVVHPNTSCANAGPIVRNELNLLNLVVDVRVSTMDSMEDVYIVKGGSCPNNGEIVSTNYSVQYEVTGTVQPPALPSTEPTSTSMATPSQLPTTFTIAPPTTTTSPTRSDRKSGAISVGVLLGIIIASVATVVIGACVISLVIFCVWRRRRRSSPISDNGSNPRPNGQVQLTGRNPVEENGHVQAMVEEEAETDLGGKEERDTKIDDDEVVDETEEFEALDTTVNRIAFVMPEISNAFQELSSVLLECHGCDRAHPVAFNGTSDSSANVQLQVCNWLRDGCLVYVMWEGSLEDLDNNSETKNIVRQFSHRRMLDRHAGAGVMHRLVFLQLGGKGEVHTRVSSNDSLWVSQQYRSTDSRFDPKLCAQEVHNVVNNRFQELDRRKTTGSQLTSAKPLHTPSDGSQPLQSRPRHGDSERPHLPRDTSERHKPQGTSEGYKLPQGSSEGPKPVRNSSEGPKPPRNVSEGLNSAQDSYKDPQLYQSGSIGLQPHHGSSDESRPTCDNSEDSSENPLPPHGKSEDPQPPHGKSEDPQPPHGKSEDPQPPHGKSENPQPPHGKSEDPQPPSSEFVGHQLSSSPSQRHKPPSSKSEKHQPSRGDANDFQGIFVTDVSKDTLGIFKSYLDDKFKALGDRITGHVDDKTEVVLSVLNETDLAEDQDLGETEAEMTPAEVALLNNSNTDGTGVEDIVDKTLKK